MSFKNYPTPHCHPASLDTASTPDAFLEREIELESTAITCTDHGTMGACREVYDLAKSKNVIPILGLEGYVRDDDCPILKAHGIEKQDGTYRKYNKYHHITFHALNQAGYEALVRELSDADFRAEQHGSERKPLMTWGQLEKLGQYDIVMTSGCLIGMVQRHLLNDRPDIAIAYYDRLRSIPKPGNFYVEVFPHRCTHYWESGVFVDLEGGEKLRFWKAKKLKTDLLGDVSAEDLAKAVSRGKEVGKLVAVMNNRAWEEREPKVIVGCKLVEDFLQNECRPWCPDGDVQLGANKFMLHLAKTRGDQVLISDDAHFATPDEKIVQDSRLGGAGGSWKFHNSYHRQTSAESYDYFHNALNLSAAEFEGMVEANRDWAQRFKDFTFVDRKSLPAKFFPSDTLGHLKTLIDKHGRMDWTNQVWVERLKKEIQMLHGNGTIDLLPYMFVAEKSLAVYEDHQLLTGPGRGSAAGLLTAYLLGITHVDPLRYDLSEDRFLTIDRVRSGKLPDIDMDLPDRDLLVDPEKGYLYKWFGDHVAAVSTNTMLRLKSSIKDVARSFHGRVDADIEVLCKKLPTPPQGIDDADFVFGYTGDDGKEVKGLFEESPELQAYATKRPKEWDIVKKMLGIARQKSRHACAFVIANEPIHNFIPLQTISGVRTTQYTAGSVEAVGGVKMDFLGLNSLKDLSKAVKLIQQKLGKNLEIPKSMTIDGKRVPGFRLVPFRGRFYDIWDLPEDTAVFNEIAESKTETVFQLNTNSARQWLRQFNHEIGEGQKAINSVEAISAFTALDRPGPLDAKVTDTVSGREHNMLVEYANRAKGMPKIGSIAALDKALPETFGVIVYQEQLERIYREITGGTAAEAEEFRRNVAKKKMDKVLKAYPAFVERATQTLGPTQAQAVWDQLVTFGQYGFNKSHSVCYSIIAYACAFLKHHYPIEWWCAVLSNANKKEITEKFWRYCKQWVDLPDVRYSESAFDIQNDRIRAPLSFINGVGPGAHDELCSGRTYVDIKDFCKKIVTRKVTGRVAKVDENGAPIIDPKTGKQKFKAGTSSLNRGLVYRLIVSGVMDSLFSKDADTLIDKIQAYEIALSDAHAELLGTRPKASKKDKEKVEAFVNMPPIARFQMQKSILPIYSESVLPILLRMNVDGITSARGQYYYKPETADVIRDLKHQRGPEHTEPLENLTLVSAGTALKMYNEEFGIYDGQRLSVAAAAYVISDRRFEYKGGTALELTVDVDGEQFSFVKWPDKKSRKLLAPPPDLSGAVVVLSLTRWRPTKPFSIDTIHVVQQPLSDGEESAEESSG
jgi:DNA-directed DNA polymerase III PolC